MGATFEPMELLIRSDDRGVTISFKTNKVYPVSAGSKPMMSYDELNYTHQYYGEVKGHGGRDGCHHLL